MWKRQTALNRSENLELFKQRKDSLQHHYDIALSNDAAWLKKEAKILGQQKSNREKARVNDEVLENSLCLEILQVDGHHLAKSALDETPADVCEKIPETFRVLRLESVIRSDLLQYFLNMQDMVRQDLVKTELQVLRDAVPFDVCREAASGTKFVVEEVGEVSEDEEEYGVYQKDRVTSYGNGEEHLDIWDPDDDDDEFGIGEVEEEGKGGEDASERLDEYEIQSIPQYQLQLTVTNCTSPNAKPLSSNKSMQFIHSIP